MVPIAGDYDDLFSEHVQAEVGIKGTFRHFGLEVTIGTMQGDDTYTQRMESPGGDGMEMIDVPVDLNGELNSVKLTATLELNPLAGVKGHEKEFNAFVNAVKEKALKEFNVFAGME